MTKSASGSPGPARREGGEKDIARRTKVSKASGEVTELVRIWQTHAIQAYVFSLGGDSVGWTGPGRGFLDASGACLPACSLRRLSPTLPAPLSLPRSLFLCLELLLYLLGVSVPLHCSRSLPRPRRPGLKLPPPPSCGPFPSPLSWNFLHSSSV